MRLLPLFIAALSVLSTRASAESATPLRLAVVGLVHGHVAGFFRNNLHRNDIQIVGICDPDAQLRDRYAKQYRIDPELLYGDLGEMLEKTRPQAAVVYTNTYDHRAAVEACAKRGIHVMMEKPLAVSLDDARAMQRAAAVGKIHALVNYETTWYPSNRMAFELSHDASLGPIRKIVVHDGHQGPKEIHVQPEFLAWLADPKLNGAGALFDFGCYGADLATWLLDGQRPKTVTAVTQQIKPEVYPKVDDEATIILTYPSAEVIIQASWNWPFNRKDMEVYCRKGYAITVGSNEVRKRLGDGREELLPAPPLAASQDDPINYFRAVIDGRIKPEGLSSLRTNMIVTEILDAARNSAKSGKTVTLPQQADYE